MTAEAYELPPVPMSVAAWRSEDIRIMIDFARLAVKQERERIAAIVRAEIERAEALMTLEEGGSPVFDREQTEAGICALRTVAAAIRAG
jgi:hypothetical protein